jgi:hypothetical protein
MNTPPNYVYAITQEELDEYWPDLKEGENFHFSSLKKKGFKCIWYALMVERGDVDMLWFRDAFELDPNKLDHSAKGYADCFHKYFGFEVCNNYKYEEGFVKIVLYQDKNSDFKHVARVLPNDNMTSKMGNYEDIEHYTMDAVSGDEYGYPTIIMKKKITEDIKKWKY